LKRRCRVAIVGCGKIAGGYDEPRSRSRGKIRTHIKAYLSDRRFSVVAVCDQSLSRARSFCRHWGIAAAYRDLEAMLQRERPDVVSVCVPTAAHRKVLEIIARHPVKLVFAEKPFTESAREAKAVLKKLTARRIAVAVNYLRRWCPNHQQLARIIRSGRLGRLRSFDAIYGGDPMNIGSHLIDLIQWLAGPIARAREGRIELGNGVTGWLERAPRDAFALAMLFDRGFIRIARYGYEGECLVWHGKRAKVLFRFLAPARGIDSAMKHAAANLLGHLQRRQALASTGRGAISVLKVCEAVARGST